MKRILPALLLVILASGATLAKNEVQLAIDSDAETLKKAAVQVLGNSGYWVINQAPESIAFAKEMTGAARFFKRYACHLPTAKALSHYCTLRSASRIRGRHSTTA